LSAAPSIAAVVLQLLVSACVTDDTGSVPIEFPGKGDSLGGRELRWHVRDMIELTRNGNSTVHIDAFDSHAMTITGDLRYQRAPKSKLRYHVAPLESASTVYMLFLFRNPGDEAWHVAYSTDGVNNYTMSPSVLFEAAGPDGPRFSAIWSKSATPWQPIRSRDGAEADAESDFGLFAVPIYDFWDAEGETVRYSFGSEIPPEPCAETSSGSIYLGNFDDLGTDWRSPRSEHLKIGTGDDVDEFTLEVADTPFGTLEPEFSFSAPASDFRFCAMATSSKHGGVIVPTCDAPSALSDGECCLPIGESGSFGMGIDRWGPIDSAYFRLRVNRVFGAEISPSEGCLSYGLSLRF